MQELTPMTVSGAVCTTLTTVRSKYLHATEELQMPHWVPDPAVKRLRLIFSFSFGLSRFRVFHLPICQPHRRMLFKEFHVPPRVRVAEVRQDVGCLLKNVE
jgi:hypothetical protein